jgi:hypothetical protein
MARMWGGVVPQQPPIMFSRPSRAKLAMMTAMSSGDWGRKDKKRN